VRTQLIHDLPGKDIRAIVDEAKKELGTACIFLFSEFDGKLNIAVGISEDLTDKFDASFFAKEISLLTKGKGGGGRKDFAQAGGEIQPSLDYIYEFILDKVKNINN
jgi:alanyl-tRNA synthetase